MGHKLIGVRAKISDKLSVERKHSGYALSEFFSV